MESVEKVYKFLDYIFLTQEETKKLKKFYNNNFSLALEIFDRWLSNLSTKKRKQYTCHYKSLYGESSWVYEKLIQLGKIQKKDIWQEEEERLDKLEKRGKL